MIKGGGGSSGKYKAQERVVKQGFLYSFVMGKGLYEPCSPYRVCNVWGEALNTPNASNWNCVPQIVGQATSFDFSALAASKEAVVTLVSLYNIPQGTYDVGIRFLSPTGTTLCEFFHPITVPAGGWAWAYLYAYIGYVPWEISKNGTYSTIFLYNHTELQRISFQVTGIPAPSPIVASVPVKVKNTSTQGGVLVPAQFQLFSVCNPGQMSQNYYSDVWAAGEERTIIYTVTNQTKPVNISITVTVETMEYQILAEATKLITP